MSDELRKALEAKSDRLNADDLMAGNRTIKITDVRVMLSASDGNIIISFEGDNGKPWKPSKGMGRALAAMWGDDERQWVGRSVELFRESTVEFGGKEVGGIQICGASHIERDMIILITKKRGQKMRLSVRKLAIASKPAAVAPDPVNIDTKPAIATLRTAAAQGMDALVSAWKATPQDIRAAINPGGGCPDSFKITAKAADDAKDAANQPSEDDVF